MTRSSFRLAWESDTTRDCAAGVSLHGHTRRSKEALTFVPDCASAVPLLGKVLDRYAREYAEARGTSLDFNRAFWQPPLLPKQAFDIERIQIEDRNLRPLVSLTDHDSIEACIELREAGVDVPVGVEWTVPFSNTFFHLGIHNLAWDSAIVTMARMADYTQRPSQSALKTILADLDAQDEALTVLNHPMWDQSGVGADRHGAALRGLLECVGPTIHAVEFNGLRSRRENAMARRLADETGRPLISGGDRHGAEPNAILNLTNASTFAEFCAEIRDGASHVLVLPQYRGPLYLRIMAGVQDVMADNAVDGSTWSDRVWWERRVNEWEPLSVTWKHRTPPAVEWFVRVVKMSEHRLLHNAAALASIVWGFGTVVE